MLIKRCFIVAIAFWIGQYNVPVSAINTTQTTSTSSIASGKNNLEPLVTAKTVRKLYSNRNSQYQNYAKMPQWWKNEYKRKQSEVRMIQYQSARESAEYMKQMHNPRSPEYANYQRVFALTHPDFKQASGQRRSTAIRPKIPTAGSKATTSKANSAAVR